MLSLGTELDRNIAKESVSILGGGPAVLLQVNKKYFIVLLLNVVNIYNYFNCIKWFQMKKQKKNWIFFIFF